MTYRISLTGINFSWDCKCRCEHWNVPAKHINRRVPSPEHPGELAAPAPAAAAAPSPQHGTGNAVSKSTWAQECLRTQKSLFMLVLFSGRKFLVEQQLQ